MNRNMTSLRWAVFLFLFFSVTVCHSQEFRDKLGFGLNLGGQRLYGDRKDVGFGIGFEGLVKYRLLEFADLAFAFGYSQLKYTSNTTDLVNADLKSTFEIISSGMVRPYIGLGVGMINFHVYNSGKGRFFDAVLFGGGGLKIRVSTQFDWLIGADYRFTMGDNLDNLNLNNEGKANDGFLNIRTGVTYYLPGTGRETFEILPMEKVPLDEVEGERGSEVGEQYNPANAAPEAKDMEEYVRLKSRIDELSERIDSKEKEISKLQGQLSERKQKITYMEQSAAKQSSVPVQTSSSMSGFSEIYEQALTNFYNKQYSEAISLFQLLLQQYQTHALVSNCQYWIGECYFAMGRYQESIDAFFKVLSFPRSLKKDDALFHLGKVYLKTGAGERAREAFARLIREYPNSEFIQDAKDYLGKL
ncbi:MAG: tetratricopeptide repeat protein [bacterium]